MKIAALCIILSIPFVSSIIGGKDKDHKENHMFVVSIQQDWEHFCCGVFVTLKFVLTASSCVKDKLPEDIRVMANITDLVDNPPEAERLNVNKIISKDPTGQKNVHNNIALLVLSSGSAMIVERSQYIRTIRLPDERNIAEEGKPCIIYGWGTKSSFQPVQFSLYVPESSDVFTRIDYHKDWILRTIDENSSTRHKQQATIMGTAIFVLWIMGRNL
ncbi:hypothetical protein HA402_011241 [Bradysia odoriphaga]|nr:hypothetical protein HA402_011241 [Bradysia odoriphaga]